MKISDLTAGLIALCVAAAAPLPLHASAPSGISAPVDDKKAPSKTGIAWKIEPAHVVVFLDGKKLGEAGSLSFTATTPGKHGVKLTKGDDETEMDIQVKKGEVLQVAFSFDEG